MFMQCVNGSQFIIPVTWNCLIAMINLTPTKHYNKQSIEAYMKRQTGDSDAKHAVNKCDLQYAIIYRLSGVWLCAWHCARRCVEVSRNIISGCIEQRAVFLDLQLLQVCLQSAMGTLPHWTRTCYPYSNLKKTSHIMVVLKQACQNNHSHFYQFPLPLYVWKYEAWEENFEPVF